MIKEVGMMLVLLTIFVIAFMQTQAQNFIGTLGIAILALAILISGYFVFKKNDGLKLFVPKRTDFLDWLVKLLFALVTVVVGALILLQIATGIVVVQTQMFGIAAAVVFLLALINIARN